LRLYNAGNPSTDSGRVCVVDQPWSEETITYQNRPQPGAELCRLGNVTEHEVIVRPLKIDLAGRQELSLVIDPTGLDGIDYQARESGRPAELIIEYELPQ